jgi:hypothetical protein
MIVILGMVLAVAAAGVPTAVAEGPLPLGTVVAVTGTVQVGRDGAWQAAAPKLQLFEGQTIRTEASSSAEVLFDGELPARLGEKEEIAVADWLLKARLERVKAKITAPGDNTKADIQVTPLTGVRGTEKTEEKAEDLKRDHYWSESPVAK